MKRLNKTVFTSYERFWRIMVPNYVTVDENEEFEDGFDFLTHEHLFMKFERPNRV